MVEQGATERTLYLPAGADWIHVWTGEAFSGGAMITVAAPLDGPPPLFARTGSAMLVDLAEGGWRPKSMRRGLWLFPPKTGSFACEAIDDAGNGGGGVTRWRVEGTSDGATVTVRVTRTGAAPAEPGLTILLPPANDHVLIVEGQITQVVAFEQQRGVFVA